LADLSVEETELVKYGFQGREMDVETGFLNFRNRIYNPVQGRFLQRDPIGFAGGMNLYEFEQSSPLNFVDPLGLFTLSFHLVWTPEERDKVNKAFEAVKARIPVVIRQIDEAIRKLTAFPKDNLHFHNRYTHLIGISRHIKQVMQGVLCKINNNKILRINKSHLVAKSGSTDPVLAAMQSVPWWSVVRSPTLWLNVSQTKDWFNRPSEAIAGNQERMKDIFHEISHLVGTHDSDYWLGAPPWWNDANVLDELMGTDFEDWSYYKVEKLEIDKRYREPLPDEEQENE
jgi:RHS repeat-associated protein